MATPVKGLRRVPFSSGDPGSQPSLSFPHSATHTPRQSPYTPFSARRLSTPAATGSGAQASIPDKVSTRAFSRPDSAEAFTRGGVAESTLRTECLDIISAICSHDDPYDDNDDDNDDNNKNDNNNIIRNHARRNDNPVPPDPARRINAVALAREMASVLEVQLAFGHDFASDKSSHPYIRQEVHRLAETFMLERNTWTLVEIAWRSKDIRSNDMISRRANVATFVDQAHTAVASQPKNSDPNSTASRSLRDRNARHLEVVDVCRRVLEWLETVAAEKLDREGGPHLQPLDDPAYRWQYTCARMGSMPNPDYALNLDPNPPSGSVLEEVEVKAENRLSHEIFRLIRAGRMEQAEEICRRTGQFWRAALLAGGKQASAVSALGIKGGARRTWRAAAQALARSNNPRLTVHERAVCGVLSGVLEPALAVAESYEDQLWARLCVLVDHSIDQTCQGPPSFSTEGAVEAPNDLFSPTIAIASSNAPDAAADNVETGVNYMGVIESFRECEGAGVIRLRDGYLREGRGTSEAYVSSSILERIRSIRMFLALGPQIPSGHVAELARELAALSHEGLRDNMEWVTRFSAHIALFVKEAGLISADDTHDAFSSCEQCLVAYARLVITQENERIRIAESILPVKPIVYDLVARHLSHVQNTNLIIEVYADLMVCSLRADLEQEKLSSTRASGTRPLVEERRSLCLQRAGKCFGRYGRETLDRLVIFSVDHVWNEHLPEWPFGKDPVNISLMHNVHDEQPHLSRDEEMVVRAIEFLIYPGFSNNAEALRRVNKATRRFFLTGRYGAARYLVLWFPNDVLLEISPEACESEIHELECWRAYMEATTRYNEWRRYCTLNRPEPLDEKVRAAALAEPGTVSYEAQAAANLRMETHTKALEAYTRMCSSACDAAVTAIRAALLFDGGWMRDFVHEHSAQNASGESTLRGNENKQAEERDKELKAVRKLGVPQLSGLLHSVLNESGLYAEAVELATVVADEGLRLYSDFSHAELQALLRRIALSAALLADSAVKEGLVVRPYKGFFFEEISTEYPDE